ncbi:hypothetical protein H6F43_03425 [Leptolyngbya sp. FACHB-36]|nr:hypothetical protein [Leptolyngbya sp. FACHB-36]
MTEICPPSSFPNHRYDFGDSVVAVPISEGGTVEAIWHHDDHWRYHLRGLKQCSACWWCEDQLKPACPRCFAPWNSIAPCGSCGLSPDDLP